MMRNMLVSTITRCSKTMKGDQKRLLSSSPSSLGTSTRRAPTVSSIGSTNLRMRPASVLNRRKADSRESTALATAKTNREKSDCSAGKPAPGESRVGGSKLALMGELPRPS